MRTKIIYEDKEILVCAKPADIAVQSAASGQMDMASELKNYLSVTQGKNPYLGIVHRLDQPVAGVIVFAKTKEAAANLSQQLTQGKMTKLYEAVVLGILEQKEGILEDYLYKDSKTNTSRVVEKAFLQSKEGKDAKLSKLRYKVKSENLPSVLENGTEEDGSSVLEVELFTGRHHQIRVQLAHIQHPILGDVKYGGNLLITQSNLNVSRRLMLVAKELRFRHPKTGEKLLFQYE